MKIALIGSEGKTGSKVYQELLDNEFEVIGIDKDTLPLIKVIEDVDLVIDFTNKEVALNSIQLCFDHNKDFIVGTTGFNEKELLDIKNKCKEKKIKGIICYNFSLPINYILNSFSFFNNYFTDMEYLDIHHISKIDKKSGTTTLFLDKNNKMRIKSIKTNKNIITYIIQMHTKYDKMILTYQVYDKAVFAKGLIYYLKTSDESFMINLLN